MAAVTCRCRSPKPAAVAGDGVVVRRIRPAPAKVKPAATASAGVDQALVGRNRIALGRGWQNSGGRGGAAHVAGRVGQGDAEGQGSVRQAGNIDAGDLLWPRQRCRCRSRSIAAVAGHDVAIDCPSLGAGEGEAGRRRIGLVDQAFVGGNRIAGRGG